MSDAFPNPFDPPAAPAPAPVQAHSDTHAAAEDAELSRALHESLALQEEEQRAAESEEQALLETVLAASRKEAEQQRVYEQSSLEQERDILERSIQEAYREDRKREAERQRHALMEYEVIERSRMEHDERMRFRSPASISGSDASANTHAMESLLWLDPQARERSVSAGETSVAPTLSSTTPSDLHGMQSYTIQRAPLTRYEATMGSASYDDEASGSSATVSEEADGPDQLSELGGMPGGVAELPARGPTGDLPSEHSQGASPTVNPWDELTPGPTLDPIRHRPSTSASTRSIPYPSAYANGSPALCGVQFGVAPHIDSLALWLPDVDMPLFATPDLGATPSIPVPDEDVHLYFPDQIVLQPSSAPQPWFVMRAYSWKVLLQAMAWYGHTALLSEHPGRLHLELAFSIPTSTYRDQDQGPAPSYVALGMTLSGPHTSLISTPVLERHATSRNAVLSTVSLGAHSLALPTDLVTLAQTLFSAPQLSSAPALRELRQVIARQDERLDARRAELAHHARASSRDTPDSAERLDTMEWSFLNNQMSALLHPGAPPPNAPDETHARSRDHLRQRMKKTLGRWNATNVAPEADLASWITPYDLPKRPSVP
ncbi:hypothetical protein MVES1_001246 [Malassezia vespertilionis]|uniref:Uncharacterized protein n=1 Tax=Malassezia vespertilionis TaxID=2020962 RepID=A0A2N1JFK1_9BASI|nr:uncharacterized protein MVES1_001246 [Malassezia vespertilionis]PKI85319.1 hypothetical protein MVES_001173 [Malassezia vespertilionis]WFD05912.1 hypothetical protein MVES1_001246 [Malassezia vespertilionis]